MSPASQLRGAASLPSSPIWLSHQSPIMGFLFTVGSWKRPLCRLIKQNSHACNIASFGQYESGSTVLPHLPSGKWSNLKQ
ncbi:hypothetical protein TcWFU_005924 [Taenia crassiceps]|uniref:Uncharacterized protein n=1 Tax=Taenia crassiceps TaxID=6207 RepID=A0ABR4QHS0_9CEST